MSVSPSENGPLRTLRRVGLKVRGLLGRRRDATLYHERARGVDLMGVVNSLSSASGPVLLFGDSVIGRVSIEESEQRPIDAMLGDLLGQEVSGIHTKALHGSAFAAIGDALIRLGARPKQVVLEVNLRSFSTQWYRHPAYQFSEDISLCERISSEEELPTVLTFVAKAMSDVPPAEFSTYADQTFTMGGLSWPLAFYQLVNRSEPRTLAESSSRRRLQLWAHYGGAVPTSHERLCALTRSVSAWRDQGTGVVVYTTPLNVDLMEFVAPGLVDVVVENTSKVLQDLQHVGARALDLTSSIHADHFMHPEEVTEHLNAKGRGFVVAQVRDELTRETWEVRR